MSATSDNKSIPIPSMGTGSNATSDSGPAGIIRPPSYGLSNILHWVTTAQSYYVAGDEKFDTGTEVGANAFEINGPDAEEKFKYAGNKTVNEFMQDYLTGINGEQLKGLTDVLQELEGHIPMIQDILKNPSLAGADMYASKMMQSAQKAMDFLPNQALYSKFALGNKKDEDKGPTFQANPNQSLGSLGEAVNKSQNDLYERVSKAVSGVGYSYGGSRMMETGLAKMKDLVPTYEDSTVSNVDASEPAQKKFKIGDVADKAREVAGKVLDAAEVVQGVKKYMNASNEVDAIGAEMEASEAAEAGVEASEAAEVGVGLAAEASEAVGGAVLGVTEGAALEGAAVAGTAMAAEAGVTAAAVAAAPIAAVVAGVALVGLGVYSVYCALTGQKNQVWDGLQNFMSSVFHFP